MDIPIYHANLLEIVFGRSHPDGLEGRETLPLERADFSTLSLMTRLLKIEFNASLQKEIFNVEEQTENPPEPKPYDVFLVEPSFKNRNITIAVSVPITKGREPLLAWYDENGSVWPLVELRRTRKVASLSGTARVLENLASEEIPPMMQTAMERTNIFDVSALTPSDNNINYGANLNKSQIMAVAAMNSNAFKDGFFVVQGPPGTGKSTTLVEMISSSNERVIASAPSNAATANIALKLFKSSRFSHSDLCVFGNNCNESVHFLNPELRKEKYTTFQEKLRKCEKDEKKVKQLLREFCQWLHLDQDLSLKTIGDIVRDISAICLLRKEEVFKDARIICCTLNSSGSKFLRKNAGFRGTFFLDEGGQCNEAEFYLAASFPRIRRIVIVGDPKQLPATTIDMQCKKSGFGVSWMERVQKMYPEKVHLLDTQYRMDPLILDFPNASFYSSRIKSGECVKSRSPSVCRPVGFIDTSNRSCEERDKFSTRNSQEASIIRALLRQDADIQTILQDNLTTVAVITPYLAQEELLKSELKKVKGLKNWTVSTVDSFQGQEADVVIISTVRTKRIGFVDDRQRLNVALTRAKRVLRVVGCRKLFNMLGSYSALRKLTNYLHEQKHDIDIQVKNVVFTMPDWRKPMLWNPTLTQRFHNCIKDMDYKQKAVILTTLQAVTEPKLQALNQHVNANEYWHVSSLRGQPNNCIVWIATQGEHVEAHFAGSRNDCLNFKQKYISQLPIGSCQVKSDLSGIIAPIPCATNLTASWKLTNVLQRAIENGSMNELPTGTFKLDPEQQAIVSSPSPLLLESRSGTGKTNVLFQHAITLSKQLIRERGSDPLGFITVSKLLKFQLEKMFNDVKNINKAALSSCAFMSLAELLDGLAERMGIDIRICDLTNFDEYFFERTSYSSLNVDQTLIENEIGGVILGSLQSAELCRALNWEEYKESQRSNISNKDIAKGLATRRLVYDQFQLYDQWKRKCGLFDINDLVLEILKKVRGKKHQFFSGVYLDEIQDFSYAMIYLICSIGGTKNLNWVFAGDTAQMISPGCSFKFAGLKQTILSVRPGIESKLKQVSHLLVNYRTTKDVLELGNAILSEAKEHFPGAIEFAEKEIAINDLGLKVVLSDWDSALKTNVSFGKDQALIHSFSDCDDNSSCLLRHWLDDHPFILSVLDSKGLEFDDVVVAFDLNRKCWKVDSKEPAALNMLRELYVAVTRAKQRVVILVKKKSDTMLKFLKEVDYELGYHPDPDKLFQEFDTCTNKHQWLERANDLFEEERFLLASRCYEKAGIHDYAAWSLGRYFLKKKMNKKEGKMHLLRASVLFYEALQFKKVLLLSSEILDAVAWDEKPPLFVTDEILVKCEEMYPDYLNYRARLRIDIFRDKWNRISVEDIKKEYVFVQKRRGYPGLVKFIRSLSDDTDVLNMAEVIPCIIGDLKYDCKKFAKAIELFLIGSDIPKAKDSSLKLVQFLKTRKDVTENERMKLNSVYKDLSIQQGNNMTQELLFSLIQIPEDTAKNRSLQCFDKLGACLIRFIVKFKKVDRTILFSFCKNSFHADVLEELKYKHKDDLKEVVFWFLSRKDQRHAMDFISERISQWNDKELENFVTKQRLHSKDIAEEFFKRQHFVTAINLFIKCDRIQRGYYVASKAVSSIEGAEKYGLTIIRLLQGITTTNQIPSNLQLLFKLYNEPEVMNKKDCSTSLKKFGPQLVQRFVFERVNKKSQEEKKYLDVLDVLKKFGGKAKMSQYDAMETFRTYKHMDTAKRFFDSYITEWTIDELFTISEKFGYYHKQLAEEFESREEYIAAIKIFLAAKCYNDAIKASEYAVSTPDLLSQNSSKIRRLWKELVENDPESFKIIQEEMSPMISAKVFLKLDCFADYAKKVCEDAISTKDLASKNSSEIKRMWLTEELESRYEGIQNDLDSGSKLYRFLLLWQEPEHANNHHFIPLMSPFDSFGPSVIEDAVLTSYLQRYSICKMDPVNILHQLGFADTTAIDVLRSLYRMAIGSKGIEHYANANVKFWSENISSFNDDDIGLLLRLNVEVPGIILEERKMFVEALKVYLKKKDIDGAIKLSNINLARKNIDDYAEPFVEVWEDAGFSKESSDIPKGCKLWLLLCLYHDPASISNTEIDQQYLSQFGHNVVKNAIQSRIDNKDKVAECLQVLRSCYEKKDEDKPSSSAKKNPRPKGKSIKKTNGSKTKKGSKSKRKTT